jgi:hypothetical protein
MGRRKLRASRKQASAGGGTPRQRTFTTPPPIMNVQNSAHDTSWPTSCLLRRCTKACEGWAGRSGGAEPVSDARLLAQTGGEAGVGAQDERPFLCA